jgi:hypothetical protein
VFLLALALATCPQRSPSGVGTELNATAQPIIQVYSFWPISRRQAPFSSLKEAKTVGKRAVGKAGKPASF